MIIEISKQDVFKMAYGFGYEAGLNGFLPDYNQAKLRNFPNKLQVAEAIGAYGCGYGDGNVVRAYGINLTIDLKGKFFQYSDLKSDDPYFKTGKLANYCTIKSGKGKDEDDTIFGNGEEFRFGIEDTRIMITACSYFLLGKKFNESQIPPDQHGKPYPKELIDPI